MTPKGSTPLNLLQVGATATIQKINGDSKLSRKLLGLGLRVGSQIDIVQHRNRGVVVANSGNRVALGQTIADKLLVIPNNPITSSTATNKLHLSETRK